jgi:hypothetical protein
MSDEISIKEKQAGWIERFQSPGVRRWIELTIAIVMALSTVNSAWCAYQSRVWGGVQAAAVNASNTMRYEAGRLVNQALTQSTVDVVLFGEYAAAVSQENQALADFLRPRFRAEFIPAFDAWIATSPLTNPDAPPSPFAMPEYQLAAQQEADELLLTADQKAQEAAQANATGAQYVLYTVLFAMVLFFSSVSYRFNEPHIQLAVIAFAILVFLIAVTLVLTSPQRLGV